MRTLQDVCDGLAKYSDERLAVVAVLPFCGGRVEVYTNGAILLARDTAREVTPGRDLYPSGRIIKELDRADVDTKTHFVNVGDMEWPEVVLPCDRCDGSGSIHCECEACGFEHRPLCPRCEDGDMIPMKKIHVAVGPAAIDARYVGLVLSMADAHDTIYLRPGDGPLSAVAFRSGEWFGLIMPLRLGSEPQMGVRAGKIEATP